MPDQDPLEVYPVDSHDEQYDRLMWGCSDDDNHGEAVWDPGRQVWVMTGSIAIPGDGTYVSHNLDITTKNGDIYGYGTDVQRDSDARIIAVWMWAVFPDEGLFAAHNWIGLLLHVHVTRPGNMLAWSDEKMARRERRA